MAFFLFMFVLKNGIHTDAIKNAYKIQKNNMLTIFILSICGSKHYAAKRIFVIFWSPAFTFRTFIKCPKNITTY